LTHKQTFNPCHVLLFLGFTCAKVAIIEVGYTPDPTEGAYSAPQTLQLGFRGLLGSGEGRKGAWYEGRSEDSDEKSDALCLSNFWICPCLFCDFCDVIKVHKIKRSTYLYCSLALCCSGGENLRSAHHYNIRSSLQLRGDVYVWWKDCSYWRLFLRMFEIVKINISLHTKSCTFKSGKIKQHCICYVTFLHVCVGIAERSMPAYILVLASF